MHFFESTKSWSLFLKVNVGVKCKYVSFYTEALMQVGMLNPSKDSIGIPYKECDNSGGHCYLEEKPPNV